MQSDVTVVVGTLDLYKDAWPPLCHGVQRYWDDCPWPVRFITNDLRAPCGKTIKVGGGRTGWSKRMRRGLERVESPVILWLTGDNWITAPPDTNALLAFANHIHAGIADHIRLYPGWDHDRSAGKFRRDPRLLTFADDSPYRCSLKPALWRRDTFLRLLRVGEAAWEFEREASRRSRRYGQYFMAVADWGYFPIVTKGDPSGDWVKSPIVKGRWTKAAKAYCDREGLKVDFSKHPVGRIIDPKLRKVDWILP